MSSRLEKKWGVLAAEALTSREVRELVQMQELRQRRPADPFEMMERMMANFGRF